MEAVSPLSHHFPLVILSLHTSRARGLVKILLVCSASHFALETGTHKAVEDLKRIGRVMLGSVVIAGLTPS